MATDEENEPEPKIDKRIFNMFKEGPRLLEDNNVRFAVMKLISCNGAESNSFTDASFAGWEQSTIFSSIYRGVCFSEKKKNGKMQIMMI